MMKKLLTFLIPIIFIFSCNNHNKEILPGSDLGDFPLEVPEQNSLMARWEKKAVIDSRLIDDMEKAGDWRKEGIGEMSYTTERSRDGKQSLRFRTSLRDEDHYRRNRSEWDSFIGGQGGSSSVQLNFNEPQDWSEFNRISFWVYVHPTSMPTYCFVISFACEGAVNNATTQRMSHFVQDLKPGEWNHVMYEIPHLQRDKVTRFTINQTLRGHNPEEEGIVTYDFDQIELQQVEADQYQGWEVAPGKFSFNHIGYRPGDPKIAMAGTGAGDNFELIDRDGNVVFSGAVKAEENSRGKFNVIDFSGFDQEGEYRLRSGILESGPFPIGETVWQQPVFKAINFFFCERCGYHVPGVHLECHKDWQGFVGDQKLIINGGWHDAGDLSQGSFRTAMSTLSMLNNLEVLQADSGNEALTEKIRSELAWGLEWLLKTRFGNGYHMSFSVMRIYTDNQVGTIDDVVSPAANIPWENFLAAAVQAKAAMMLEKSHPELAQRARTAALEDWQAASDTCDVHKTLNYREASWGVSASILLKQMTGEDRYAEHAIKYGNMLVKCQEQKFVGGIPISGYFYNDTDRKNVIHNHHAAFEEAPLIALAMLCREFPDHPDWMNWYSAAVLHSEYFMKRGSRIAAPYHHLPNSVWKKSDILADTSRQRQADMLRQFNDGTKLNDEYVLRTFPIYRDNLFHGNTNIHMSSAWALAEASRLRND
ncbi:MAG TPA: glycoside hydrolase family 9 protein, partial [Cyclobacteriaceae bacterium]|nr:glycoside hydrolase family 9 protein [Cyclobacteriaceae bacterium]